MGGLFGGGGSSKPKTPTQEPSPPVDMSGAKIPGDDKIAMRMDSLASDKRAAKAGQTLLGRSAPANPQTVQPTANYR